MRKGRITGRLLIITLSVTFVVSLMTPHVSAFEQKKWFVPEHGDWYIYANWIIWWMWWDAKPCSWPWECLDFEVKPKITEFEYDGGTIYSNLPDWRENIAQPDEQNPNVNDISVLCTSPHKIQPASWYYIYIPIDPLEDFEGAEDIWIEVEYMPFYYWPWGRQYEYFRCDIRSSSPYSTDGVYEQLFDKVKPANNNHKAHGSVCVCTYTWIEFATITIEAYNADPYYARAAKATINGHTTTVISWLNPGQTLRDCVQIPKEWVIDCDYNDIYAWVTTYDQYDGGNSWVSLTLKVSNPSHEESHAGTWG